MPAAVSFLITGYREKQVAPGVWECLCTVDTIMQVEYSSRVLFHIRATAALCAQPDGRLLLSVLHISEPSVHQIGYKPFPMWFSADTLHQLTAQSQQELMDLLNQVMPRGILGTYLEEGFPIYTVNDVLLEQLGYSGDALEKACGGKLEQLMHPDDVPQVHRAIYNGFAAGRQFEMEVRLRRSIGDYLYIYCVGRKILTPEGREALIAVVVNNSKPDRSRSRLQEEADSDYLTGLYNRKGGTERIVQALEKSAPYLFLFLDIDNFKEINDLYGHQEGDSMLQFTAHLLRQYFRSTDILVRLGGDEFVAFVQQCGDKTAMERKIQMISRRYKREVQRKYSRSGSTLSFGGVYSLRKMSFDELYNRADSILYRVKNSGKDDYYIETV